MTYNNAADLSWFKSSYSAGPQNDCVEVSSDLHSVVPVRDSKDTSRTPLVFSRAAFAVFVQSVGADVV